MISDTRLLNGRVVESSDADNALATATVAAIAGVRHFMAGLTADYSVIPAAGIKLIQIKVGTTVVKNIRWNPIIEFPFRFAFPVDLHGDYNQAISAELQASGTGGQTGRVSIHVYSE